MPFDSALSDGGNVLIHEHCHGNDVVISFSNVGMDSLVVTFFLYFTAKCVI